MRREDIIQTVNERLEELGFPVKKLEAGTAARIAVRAAIEHARECQEKLECQRQAALEQAAAAERAAAHEKILAQRKADEAALAAEHVKEEAAKAVAAAEAAQAAQAAEVAALHDSLRQSGLEVLFNSAAAEAAPAVDEEA